ncbi:HNH endonuclease [Brachybacterium horti]
MGDMTTPVQPVTEVLVDLAHTLGSPLPDVAAGMTSAGAAQLLGASAQVRARLDALDVRARVIHADALRRERLAESREWAAREQEGPADLEAVAAGAERAAVRDASMILRSSPAQAALSLAAARRLVEDMPQMLHALGSGAVTARVAGDAATVARVLEPEQRRDLDAALAERAPYLDGAGHRRWRREISTLVEQIEPLAAGRRHARALDEQHVRVTPGEHGMATLSARLPGLEAAAIRKRLSLEAEGLRAQGDRRGHGRIMAQSLVATLLGREDAMDPVVLDVGVIITERALLSPDHGDVAHIEGYGAVPADALRGPLREALAEGTERGALLRRLFTHPVTGELVAGESRARLFPRSMRRFLHWRDTTCRAPFCDAPVRQYDHILPVAAGGPTTLANGEGLCARCQRKEEDAVSVEREPVEPGLADVGAGHHVTWTSASLTRRTTTPTRFTAPVPTEGLGQKADAGTPPQLSPPPPRGAGRSLRPSPSRRPPERSGRTSSPGPGAGPDPCAARDPSPVPRGP